MRRFLFFCILSTLALFLTGSVLPVYAAPPQTAQAEAMSLLLHGRRFERAAELMEASVAEKPDDYEAYLTLGCAYANRGVSFAYADLFTKMVEDERRQYPALIKRWEDAQNDKNDNLYGVSRPQQVPTVVFPTRDDSKPYRLTQTELATRLSDLFGKAQVAWDKAVACAKTDDEKAHAEYVRGWGMRVLQSYGDALTDYKPVIIAQAVPKETVNPNAREVGAAPKSKGPPLIIKNVPTRKESTAAFTHATQLVPDSALYWQALGDNLDSDDEKATYYEKSLALNPKNGQLWAELYRRTTKETYRPAPDALLNPKDKRANVEKGVEYLAQITRFDRRNAWPLYEEAVLRLKREMFLSYLETRQNPGGLVTREAAQKAVQVEASVQVGRQAIQLIEMGNQREYFHSPFYKPSIPGVLQIAWKYFADLASTDWTFGSRLRELARAVSGYGLAMVYEKGDKEEGIRALRVLVAMGLKLAGDFPTKDAIGDMTFNNSIMGRVIATRGLTSLAQIYEKMGDKAALAAVTAEQNALLARNKVQDVAARIDVEETWEYYYK